MKTSNKMLIGIAVAILVIPISTMVFSSLSGRVDYDVYMRGVAEEGVDLNAEDNFLSTTKLEKFNKVKLEGSGNIIVGVHLIKSDEYAVKVNKADADEFVQDIDDQGTLYLSFKKANSFHLAHVYLYGPDLNGFEIDNIFLNELHSEQDSLRLVLNNFQSNRNTLLGENSNLKYLHLRLNKSAWTMQGSSPMFANLQTLQLDLDSSTILLQSDHYQHITVDANGSKFIIEPGKGKNTTVGTLNVNTFGRSTISLEGDIQIDSLNGIVSDSTTMKLPYYMVKELVER